MAVASRALRIPLSLSGLQTLRDPLDALPRARYVWIARRDRLRQAISWERAEQSGTWARLAGERAPAVPRPAFDPHAIARRMAEIETQEAAWRGWFEEAGATPTRVAYEDLAANYKGTARRVTRELGLAPPRALDFGERVMVAMGDRVTEQWVGRYARLSPV